MVRKILGILPHQIARSGFIFSVIFACLFLGSTELYSQTTISETTPGTYTFTVPAGVTSIRVQAWGAGGGGGSISADGNIAGGGGGGAYAESTLTVSAGQVYTYVVGQGGIAGSPSTNGENSYLYLLPGTNLVEAGGGETPEIDDLNGGQGGTVITGTGFLGGNGGPGYIVNGFFGDLYNGGGGGSSAGSTAPGVDATNFFNRAVGPPDGGDGGDGSVDITFFIFPAGNGSNPGGGGGGNTDIAVTGTTGGDGQVLITYTCSTFSLTSSSSSTPINENDAATVTLTGNLPVGNYIVTYDLSAPNAVTGNTAGMTVTTSGTGTFVTSNLPNSGSTNITITDISSGGCSSAITSNNIATVEVCPVYSLTSTSAVSPITYQETTDITLNGNLPIGTYTVTYDLSGANTATGSTASMTVTTAGTGTFTTATLNFEGATTITITDITNGSCSSVVSVNNSASVTVNEPELSIFGDGNPVNFAPDFLSSLFDFDNLTDFGFVGVGETITQTFTLSNVKSGVLDVSDLVINFEVGDLSQFSLDKTDVDTNSPLAGFNSANFDISFTPTSVGVNAIQVSVGSNDPTYNPFTFWIQGNGVKAAAPYCTPTKLQGNDSNKVHFISNVDIRTINNSTTGVTSKYSNFTDPSDPDIPGFDPLVVGLNETVTGTVSVTVNGDNTNTNELVIWLDYDQDLDLEDTATEKYSFPVTHGFDTGTATKEIDVPISFNVPAGATLGTTRMRIAFHDDNNSYDACDFNKNKGEVEDYSITVQACGLNTWTGAINSDWNNTGNWSCGQIPSDASNGNILITDVSPNASPVIPSAGAAGYAYSLEIDPTGTLEVQNNYIDIESSLQIDGVLTLTGEGQLLQQPGSTFDDDSTGYLERTQQGTADLYTYNYWSSPVYIDNSVKVGYGLSRVNNYTLAGVLPNVSFVSGLDGAPGPPVEIADYWIFKFNDKSVGDYSEWVQVGSTGDIISGEGYTMKGSGSGAVADPQDYVFQGKPNNGDITLDLAAGNGYLLGNPYPSALDADQFIFDNVNNLAPNPVFDGTLYYWEHVGGGSHNLSDYQGGYATYNLSGGIGSGGGVPAPPGLGTKTPQRYIPVGQGFFVTADAGGTITFSNSQRTFITEGAQSIFFKNQNQEKVSTSDARTKLRIGIEMDKGFKKEILLTEDANATNGFDYGYDGKLIDGYGQDIYWNIEDEMYSIQGVPKMNKNSVFELGVLMEYAGEVKIGLNDFVNRKQLRRVFLLDRQTKKVFNITKNSISLKLEEGDHKGRFAITFLPKAKPISNQNQLEDGIEAVMNNVYKEVQITRMVDAEIKEVSIFNLLGQKVQSTSTGLKERYIRIPVAQRQGVYVLRIETNKGPVGKQIIIEE